VLFSPDGKFLAARGADGAIHLWELVNGKEVLKLAADPEDFSPLAFTRDSKTLATAAEKMIRFWDLGMGREVGRLTGQEPGSSTFSDDGKTFTTVTRTPGEHRMTAYIWDVAGRKLRRKFNLSPNPVFVCRLSPDGRYVLAGGFGGNLQVFDLVSGREACRLATRFLGAVFAAAFSPDGKVIAVGGENRAIQLWDAATGRALDGPESHQGAIQALALSADGKTLVSGASDGTCLWDLKTARPRTWFRPPGRVAFSPNGRKLAVASGNPFIRLLEIPSGEEVRRFPAGAQEWQSQVAISPNGAVLAAGGEGGIIRLWEMATGKLLRQLLAPPSSPGNHNVVFCLAFSPDGRFLAAGSDSPFVHIWDTATGELWCRLPGHDGHVGSLAFSPDGRTLATAPRERAVCLWEVLSGKKRGRLEGHTDWVTGVTFSPDGHLLATGSHDKVVRLWEWATGKEVGRFTGHTGVIGPLVFSADGRHLISGGWDTTILIWDLGERRLHSRSEAVELSAEHLDRLWADLAAEDARTAHAAIGVLVGAPRQAVPLLGIQLRPVAEADAGRMRQLVADLDSDRFAVRERAEADLEALGEQAGPALRQVLQGHPSLELRQRVQRVLAKLEGPVTVPQRLRLLRAVEALESIGTSEARQVLAKLAKGAPEARLTQEAKASLQRVARRTAHIR
jgi:WD40 repeat protein